MRILTRDLMVPPDSLAGNPEFGINTPPLRSRQPFPCRFLASILILGVAAAAPWIAGAHSSLPLKGWWLGAPLAGAYFLIWFHHLRAREFFRVPWVAGLPVLFLLGCLAWWAGHPEPEFATAFSAEHWRFLERTFPFAIFEWPRAAHLAFLACVLLGFLATLDLGAKPEFRRELCQVIGVSGLVFGLYALGIRWLGWSTPPWIDLAGDTEQFNVGYFHHNAPGASLNLAWPLLLFCSDGLGGPWRKVKRGAILLVVVAALPLWHSRAPQAVAVGLLVSGALWQLVAGRKSPWQLFFLRGMIAVLFLAVSAWQWWSVEQMRATQPDQWMGAAQTQHDAAVRDISVKAAALKRGDRLVASSAPPRATAWLAAARMTRDYPLVGLGPGAWLKRGVIYSNDTLVNTFYQHRQFVYHDLLQTAAEWGGLAALAWLALWIGALWRETRRAVESPAREIGLVLAVVGIALHSTVHFPLQNPALLLWTLLLLGLAWSRQPQPLVTAPVATAT